MKYIYNNYNRNNTLKINSFKNNKNNKYKNELSILKRKSICIKIIWKILFKF